MPAAVLQSNNRIVKSGFLLVPACQRPVPLRVIAKDPHLEMLLAAVKDGQATHGNGTSLSLQMGEDYNRFEPLLVQQPRMSGCSASDMGIVRSIGHWSGFTPILR